MLVKAPENAPIFFLVGPRATAGGTEEVGTVVWRQKRAFDGTPVDPEAVLAQDVPHTSGGPSGPFKFENEIAVFKPKLDVVVVSADFEVPVGPPPPPPPPTTLAPFGNINITRAGVSTGNIAWSFDWLPRSEAPRLGLAGDAAGFDPDVQDLPTGFDNIFLNGQPTGADLLSQGDTVAFLPLGRTVTIPAPPRFEATQDGAALDPPLTLTPLVDTVVADTEHSEFVIVWRAVFPWETRFENATLEAFDG
jgi:hypothetical protein